MLFLGFGLRDPNFERIYDDARSFFDSAKRQSYAFMTGTDAIQRHFWHKAGLTILPLTRNTQLQHYLGRLRVA
jgi:hypothetical protein